jgi:phospholipid/cholesterol/gamma-HCH transport system substrate-binding protein
VPVKPFRERNPIPIAILGLTFIAALLFVAFKAGSIQAINPHHVYKADFAEAAGLTDQNEVRIAGIRVGKVHSVKLDGDHVRVEFEVDKGQKFGVDTRANIKLKTLLGTKFLELVPDGSGQLAPGALIPQARTTVPFEIFNAFGELSTTIDQIDTDQLAKALDTLSDTFENTPQNSKAALRGLSRLSTTIASRDRQIADLLAGTKTVTKVLSDRDAELIKLMGDADLVLRTIQQRRAIISKLLIDTKALADELSSLVRDDRSTLDPLLDNIHQVVLLLKANLGSLDKSLKLLGPFARYGANATGNGHWLDVYAENLVISDAFLCSIGAAEGCS